MQNIVLFSGDLYYQTAAKLAIMAAKVLLQAGPAAGLLPRLAIMNISPWPSEQLAWELDIAAVD